MYIHDMHVMHVICHVYACCTAAHKLCTLCIPGYSFFTIKRLLLPGCYLRSMLHGVWCLVVVQSVRLVRTRSLQHDPILYSYLIHAAQIGSGMDSRGSRPSASDPPWGRVLYHSVICIRIILASCVTVTANISHQLHVSLTI